VVARAAIWKGSGHNSSLESSVRRYYETRKNDIVEFLNYQIPVTHLKGPKADGDMQAAKRAYNAPPLSQYMVMWAAGRFKSYVR